MMRLRLLLAALLLALCARLQADPLPVVTIATGEWPPYISEHIKYQGVTTRIVAESFAAAGVKVQIRFFPWQRVTALVQSRAVDAAYAYSRSAERDRDFLFSQPVIVGENVFYHRKGKVFDWRRLADLGGERVAITEGYNYGAEFEQAARGHRFIVDPSVSDVDSFNKLLAGRVDLVLANRDLGDYILQTRFPTHQSEVIAHPRVLVTLENCLIVSRAHPRAQWLIDTFNRGLKVLQAQGKLQRYQQESRRGEYLLVY
jgi:polar amino acid transport system substrate-binding protein